jgi:hypothetical protein
MRKPAAAGDVARLRDIVEGHDRKYLADIGFIREHGSELISALCVRLL